MRVTSGEAGAPGVVPKVADKGVLVIVVHVGDDALLRCFIRTLRAFLCHSGCTNGCLPKRLKGGRRMEQTLKISSCQVYTTRYLHVIHCGLRAVEARQAFLQLQHFHHQEPSSIHRYCCRRSASTFKMPRLIQQFDRTEPGRTSEYPFLA